MKRIWKTRAHLIRRSAILEIVMSAPAPPFPATPAAISKETTGAWIVHHGQKVMMDANGPSEFPAIEQAAKATALVVALAGTAQTELPIDKVRAIGRAARLNPKRELQTFLALLQDKQLIELRGESVFVLGLTGRAALTHAADLFEAESPDPTERAAIELAELSSRSPIPASELVEYTGEAHRLTREHARDFLRRAEEIGFVDSEGVNQDRLIFNGNLFRRDSVRKAGRVLESLNSSEQRALNELNAVLLQVGCVLIGRAIAILGDVLLDKLKAAGVIELNTVQNDAGQHVFVTLPAAFHKYNDPMLDDTFDLAKALVAALTYGMTLRSSGTGRIQNIDALLAKLISGRTVGPTTSIGADYRVLEQKRVVEIISEGRLFRMRLLKTEVGEIARQVLLRGDASASVVDAPPAAAMAGYVGPEETRWSFRKTQGQPSKRATFSVIEALRSNRRL